MVILMRLVTNIFYQTWHQITTPKSEKNSKSLGYNSARTGAMLNCNSFGIQFRKLTDDTS